MTTFADVLAHAHLIDDVAAFNHELDVAEIRRRNARAERDRVLGAVDTALHRCPLCDALTAPTTLMRVRHRCSQTRRKEAA